MPGRKKCFVSKDITDGKWNEHFERGLNESYTPGSDLHLKKMILVVETKI